MYPYFRIPNSIFWVNNVLDFLLKVLFGSAHKKIGKKCILILYHLEMQFDIKLENFFTGCSSI